MANDLTFRLYEAINEQDTPREIKNWHASSIAKCPAALYLERKQVPALKENEPGGGKKLRWRGGHAVETAIRPELEKIFPGMLSNIRFTNEELDLTGEFDGYHPETKTLISVKSTHDFAFISRGGRTGLKNRVGTNANGKAAYDFKEDPYIHHQWQEHAYVLLMGHETTVMGHSDAEMYQLIDPIMKRMAEKSYHYDAKIFVPESIVYVYVTLGGLIDTFRTPVKPELVTRVSDKLKYLRECWAAQKLPMCLCKPGQEMFEVQDQWCQFKTADGCCSKELLNG